MEQAEVSVVEHVEGTRFLGSEFLIWLWFKVELFDGHWVRPDSSALQVVLHSQLSFANFADRQERTTLRGINPSATNEAKMALLCGKVPISAKISFTLDESQDFTFVLDGLGFSFSSVKIPQAVVEGDEQFFDRMQLIDTLQTVFAELYAEFLSLRSTALWEKEFVPAVVAWSHGEESLSERAYGGLLKRAVKR